jgi:predicted Fe-Mo cluster-binding NifX family protein
VKVALTIWGTRVSPVFDSARTMLLVEIENGVVVGKRYEALGSELPFARAQLLSGRQVDLLICGAISSDFSRAIESYGIRMIPFITGETSDVLDAFLRGALVAGSFRMPGCGMGRHKRFRGGYR